MSCRGCESDKIILILDLGEQPWCNDFLTAEQIGTEPTYPLRLCYCEQCELLQLDHTVSKETMFSDHQYLSGMTQTLVEHFYNVAKECTTQIGITDGDVVVDIGGNDGTQLLQYQKLGINSVFNVESAKRISQLSTDAGIPTINEYFNEETALSHFGTDSVKLFNASGVFFHLEELHSVIRGIKNSLNDDGALVVQFMYAGSMVENNNFDTIYHEHLCYYTVNSLSNLLKPYDLEIFDAELTEIHSGSVVAKICHSHSKLNKKTDRCLELLEEDKKYTIDRVKEFALKVESERHKLRSLLSELKNQGKTIYAFGAPAKGNTLLNYFNIDRSLVDKSVEINPMKVGHYLPQSHIPIVQETKDDLPDYYLLLSHNFAEEIIEKNKDIIEKGVKFIIPFPEVEIRG